MSGALEAEFKAARNDLIMELADTLTDTERKNLRNAFVTVAEHSGNGLKPAIQTILSFASEGHRNDLDDPKLDMEAGEAHRRDTHTRGVRHGLDEAFDYLFDPETIEAAVERLTQEKEVNDGP